MVALLSSMHTQAEVDSTHPGKKPRMIHEDNLSRGRRHSRPNASHVHHENDDMAVTNDNINTTCWTSVHRMPSLHGWQSIQNGRPRHSRRHFLLQVTRSLLVRRNHLMKKTSQPFHQPMSHRRNGHAASIVTGRKTRSASLHDSLVIKLCARTLEDCL